MFRRKTVSFKPQSMEGKRGGIYIGPTKGLSVPKNHRKGCLCVDTAKYSRECCNQYLQNQGIGQTQVPPLPQPCKRYTLNQNLYDVNEIRTITYIDCNGNEQTITSRWNVPQSPEQPSGTIIRLVAREIIDDAGLPFVEYDEDNITCDLYIGGNTFGFSPTQIIVNYIDCNGEYISQTSGTGFTIPSTNAQAIIHTQSRNSQIINTNLDT